MATTAERLASINEAIESGTLEVRFGDRMQKFPSIEALIKAKNHILKEATSSNGRKGSIRTFRVNVSKL